MRPCAAQSMGTGTIAMTATALASRAAAALLAAGLAFATPVHASSLTLDFDYSFGAVPSDGTAPWLRAVFQDQGAGIVRLTLSAPGLSADTDGGQPAEYADEWWFNLNADYSADNLTAAHVSGLTVTGIDRPGDPGAGAKLKPDGDGTFSFRFNYAPGTMALGQTSTYDLAVTGYPGLTASDFNYFSIPSGGAGPFRAAAHVQSTGLGNEGSDFVAPNPIPEPASLALLTASLLGLGLARRGRRSTT